MADNTNSNTNTPAPQTTTSAPGTNESLANYTPLNAQESKAQDIVAENRVDTDTTKAATVASSSEAFSGMDILDAETANAAGDLNAIDTAAGQPMNSANAGTNAPLSSGLGFDRSVVAHNLNKPVPGQTTTIDVQPGELLATTFDPNSAELDMQGKDLVMQFNDGSKIVLQDFAADAQNMPSIALPNGAIVAGGIIVAQLQGTNEDLFNLETAAGATGGDGGFFIYNDNMGNIIDLLNKLPPIPFTALQFNQPEPRVFFADDAAQGDFVPDVETDLGGTIGKVSGGFEDWQPYKNTGDDTEYPAVLKIAFTPNDNEVVDTVTISNIPAGVHFYYGTPGNYTEVTATNGSITFSAADLASGNVFVKAEPWSDHDTLVTIGVQIRDPDTNQTITLTKDLPIIFDAVADKPIITTNLVMAGDQDPSADGVKGNEGTNVNLDLKVVFPDKDGSETHTVTMTGIPAKWILENAGDVDYTSVANGDGTVTYTFTFTGDLNTTLHFNPNDWTSTNDGGPAKLNIHAVAHEKVDNDSDLELTYDNNTAVSDKELIVDIKEDIPEIEIPDPSRPDEAAPPAVLREENLRDNDPTNDSVTREITIDFKDDGDFKNGTDGAVKLSTDGLPNLTSNGVQITYTLSADGRTITATAGGVDVFKIELGTLTASGDKHKIPYTFTLLQPIDHANANGKNGIEFPVKFTVTDDDNDSVNGKFNVGIVDDVPVANPDVNTIPGDHTVATAFAVGNILNNDVGNIATHNTPGDVTVLKDVSFGGTVKSFDNALSDANGKYVIVQGAYGTLKVYENGNYRYDYDTTKHSGNHTEQFKYSIIDKDGDVSQTTLTINIKDNVPEIEIPDPHYPDLASPPSIVDEHNLPNGASVTKEITVEFHNQINFNQPGTTAGVKFSLDGLPQNLTADGNPITYSLSADGKTITASANGQVVFTVSMGAPVLVPGTTEYKIPYTFNLQQPVDHAAGGGKNTIDFPVKIIATDADGDSTSGKIQLGIIDDVPTVQNVDIGMDETNGLNHVINGTLNHTFGADGAGSVVASNQFNTSGSVTAGGLKSNGENVTVTLVGNKYVGVTSSGKEVFTLEIQSDGKYTFTQKGQLDHADGNNPNDVINLNFGVGVKDFDGDVAPGTITVKIVDDAPIARDDVGTINDGETVATGNVLTNDTLSHDNPNLLTEASANGVTKYFSSPDGQDAGGKYVTLEGEYGTLKIYENGEYEYKYDSANHGPTYDRFDLPDNALGFPLVSERDNAEDRLTPEEIKILVDTAEAMQIDYPTKVTIELVKAEGTVAGYGNGLGAFTLNSDGSISNVDLLFGNATANANNPLSGNDLKAEYNMTSNSGRVVFFLVQDAFNELKALGLADSQGRATDPNGSLSMEKQADGTLKLVYTDGNGHETVLNSEVYTSEKSFNGDGESHAIAGIAPNTVDSTMFGFEDLTGGAANGSDRDFNDVMFRVDVDGRFTQGGEMKDHFTYTVKDKDGDTSKANLDFNIKDDGPGLPPNIIRDIDETTDIGVGITGHIVVEHASSFSLGSPGGAALFAATGSLKGGSLTSEGAPVTVSLINGKYVGMAGTKEVFTLSINNDGTFTFTQKAPLDHADGSNPNDIINLNFVYTARDADGDAVQGKILINVRDDAPLAAADIGNIPDGSSVAIGNVLTNDTLSVDGANMLKNVSFGGTVKSFDGAASENGVKFVIINGAYGQLKIFQDGKYTYTYNNANHSGNLTEQFKYTLVDRDGDTSQTTLTLNIVDGGPGTAPSIVKTVDETTDIGTSVTDTISVPGATTYAGGNTSGVAEFTSGGSQQGGSLKSNGEAVTVKLVNGVYVGSTASGKEVFTLTIGSDGKYTFVQKAPLDHANGSDANDVINLNFTYTAKDADGDAVSGKITVNVRDDAPLAVADVGTIPNGSSVAEGNLLSNDVMSKDVANLLKDVSFGGTVKSFDGAASDAGGKYVVINGAYGTLKVYENGKYIYTYDNANHSGNHTEQFKYTLIDRDGDSSQTTLTLNIVDNGPGTPANVVKTVDETTDIGTSVTDTLSVPGATTYAGGNASGAAEFTSGGSLQGGSLKSNGEAVTVKLVNGVYVGSTASGKEVFTLTINSNGQYTFVQKAPLDHANGSDANDVINLNFTYTAKDADGDAVSGKITINVRDDAPLAVADVNSIPNGSSVATGDLLSNDVMSKDVANLLKDVSFGGTVKSFDGAASDAGGKYVIIAGAYGSLKVYENGKYTYTYDSASHNGNLTEQFKYTLVDRDGDTSQTTLTLNITDNGPGTAPSIVKTIDETTDIGVSVTDTISVPGATTYAGGNASGTAEFTSGGSLQGGALKSNGEAVTVKLVNGVYVGSTASGKEVFTLTINSNGSYTFVQKAPLDHADGTNANDVINLNFTYTAKDADGDAVSGKITVNVRDDAPVAVADVNSIPNGASVATGDLLANDVMSKDVANVLKDVSFGGTVKSFDGAPSDAGGKYVVINGAYGTLKVYENGKYTYTYDNANHSGNHTEQFKYTLVDRDGDSSQTTLTLNIVDNGPGTPALVEKTIDETTDINKNITDTVVVQGASNFALGTVTGAADFTSGGSLKGGALSSHGEAVTVKLVNGVYVGSTASGKEVFTLTIGSDGKYTFVQKAPLDHADGSNANDIINLNFTYTARDADGDGVEGHIQINIKDDAPIISGSEKSVDETSNLNQSVSGNVNVNFGVDVSGKVEGSNQFNATGSINGGLKSNGADVVVTYQNGQYVGKANGAIVFTLTINADGSYNFVQNKPLDHADGANPNDFINLNFGVKATDFDGDAANSTITIKVVDDAPVAVADTNHIAQNADTATGNVLTNDTMSHDGSNVLKDVSFNGTTYTFTNGQPVVINAAHGTLTIAQDGSYTYKYNGNGDGSLSEKFNYTLKDFDGDTSKTTLDISIDAATPKLIVGENVDDKPGSTTPYEVGTGTGTITGGGSHDILIGDVGGASIQNQTKDYNIVLVLDISGSMKDPSTPGGLSKFDLLKQAVTKMMADLDSYQGGRVMVHITPFATTASKNYPEGTFDLSTPNGYADAMAYINKLAIQGNGLDYTNYEAPLADAGKWLQGNGPTNQAKPIAGAETHTYFISDGDPNRYQDANGNTQAGSVDRILGEILGSDGSNEVGTLQGFGEVHAIGVGVNSTTLARLDLIDSGKDALHVQKAEDLDVALQGVNPIHNLNQVGGDIITGGNGNDVIFGDSLNTDKLAHDLGLTTPLGAGWNVFSKLEADHGWSRTQTMDYIRNHLEELARETHTDDGKVRTGGNDTLTGGDGHDIIFGQEGNDTINAGAGNDILSGGTGNNTLTGGAGADTFLFLKAPVGAHLTGGHDTITDYNLAQGDKLDISDLLVGSSYNPVSSHVEDFIKIDHATGNVFVDTTGNGSFNANNHVATINNIGSIDTINVIFHDNDPNGKLVHTV